MSRLRDTVRRTVRAANGGEGSPRFTGNPSLHRRLDEQEQRLNRQVNRIDAMQKRVDDWSGVHARNRVEYDSSTHQIAAIEQRLAALEAADVDPADDAARAEARSIVEAVRAEHSRIRVRLALVSAFEERLRRLEAAVIHAIALERFPAPRNEHLGSEVIAARESGAVAPSAEELPAPLVRRRDEVHDDRPATG